MEMRFDQTPRRGRARGVPESLIYEILDGKPVYRKGYRQVLNGTQTLEEIIPASTLQSAILSLLLRLIFRNFDEELYFVFINEPGLHLNKRVNLAGDILIFDKKTLRPGDIDRHFARVPPLVHIEVDMRQIRKTLAICSMSQPKPGVCSRLGFKRSSGFLPTYKAFWLRSLVDPGRPLNGTRPLTSAMARPLTSKRNWKKKVSGCSADSLAWRQLFGASLYPVSKNFR